MIRELIFMNGYGFFVWLSFLITIIACALIYYKTYKTLRFNFSSSDPSLSKDKKLNTDIWYEEGTYLWVKAAFDKTGYWEYRLKKAK